MNVRWRVLSEGPQSPARNMAVDEALMRLAPQSPWDATLRLYAWNPPTLSLGYAQDMASAADEAACGRLGVAIVRRPTGGWAVLHDDELTYSVTASLSSRSFGGCDLTESYRRIAEAFRESFVFLGIPCRIVEQAEAPMKAAATVPCFQVPSRHEITAPDGRKLVGSAQRRTNAAFLQHGSVPVTLNRGKLYAATGQPPAPEGERFAALGEIAPGPLSFGILAEAMKKGFARRFGAVMEEASLSMEEKTLAAALEKSKYGGDDWNRRKKEPEGRRAAG